MSPRFSLKAFTSSPYQYFDTKWKMVYPSAPSRPAHTSPRFSLKAFTSSPFRKGEGSLSRLMSH